MPDRAFAAIGTSFAQSSRLPELGWTEAQIEAFIDGVRGALHGKPYPFDEAARQVSAEMGRRVQEIEKQKKQTATAVLAQPGALEQFLKEARKRFSLQKADSGLYYRVDPSRGGSRPRPGDTVVLSCITTSVDGTTPIPQLTSERATMKMTELIPGFMEGLQMMTVESKAVFIIPPALSFGEGEWPPGVDRGIPLILQVALHEVIGAETTP